MIDLETIAKKMLHRPRGTVIFTGAGMSTESGLSDFRSKDGMWAKLDPMELATASAMRGNYSDFQKFYSARFDAMGGALPNDGHKIIADWEERGIVDCVITQNIDGLHAAAGSKTVYELHGTVSRVICMECGAPASREDFKNLRPCQACGGRLRPAVVLFGEGLPADALDASWNAAENADVFIVLGSSLQVAPASQIPVAAKRAGACLVICNRDVTPSDSVADYLTHEGIGAFLKKLDGALGGASSGDG